MPFKVLGLLFGNKENPAGGEGKGLGTSQRGAWPRPQLGYLLDGRVVVESGPAGFGCARWRLILFKKKKLSILYWGIANWASLVAQTVKRLPAMQETWVRVEPIYNSETRLYYQAAASIQGVHMLNFPCFAIPSFLSLSIS